MNIYKKQNTQENFIQLKKLRAKSKFLIKNNKKNSWKEFTSTLNFKTDAAKLWNKIQALKGLNRNQEIHVIDEQETTSVPEGVAEKMGTYFYQNFSNIIYKSNFVDKIKTPTENTSINPEINHTDRDQINQGPPPEPRSLDASKFQ